MSKRILVVGAGFGGAYAAQRLLQRLSIDEAEVVVIDRNNFLLYYPLLIEATVGIMEPRHVVVPVRKFLKDRGRFIMAEVKRIDLAGKSVTYQVEGAQPETLTFDHLIYALGSVTQLPSKVQGLKEHGFQLKTIMQGINLRDRGIQMLERASETSDAKLREEMLTFVVVGGNLTGVEFAGEFEAFLHSAVKSYPNLKHDDVKVVLVEYGPRLLPAMHEKLGIYVARRLRARGVRVETGVGATGLTANDVELANGERIPTQTVLWAAGIAPHPILHDSQFPLNQKGYIDCGADMLVKGFNNVWAVGDSATIPDGHGGFFTATAQNASRQGPAAADNVIASLRGQPTKPFHHLDLGTFAAFGNKEAAATVLGVDFKGFIGWALYRGAYLTKFPTFRLKFRMLGDWFADLILPYPPVQLGGHRPDVDPPAAT